MEAIYFPETTWCLKTAWSTKSGDYTLYCNYCCNLKPCFHKFNLLPFLFILIFFFLNIFKSFGTTVVSKIVRYSCCSRCYNLDMYTTLNILQWRVERVIVILTQNCGEHEKLCKGIYLKKGVSKTRKAVRYISEHEIQISGIPYSLPIVFSILSTVSYTLKN